MNKPPNFFRQLGQRNKLRCHHTSGFVRAGLLCWPLLVGCVDRPLVPDPKQSADAQTCFMRAMSYCREVGPSCLDAELRACDDVLARDAAPMTQGLRKTLVSCFEQDRVESDVPPSNQWRRCLHLLEAE
jgi:hypothetical protein